MSWSAFEEFEHRGWLTRASTYEDTLGEITSQAVESVLASFGNLAGKHLLDIACGTGTLADIAARRGAESEGIDFAATMIEVARAKHPGITFVEGDAERLPYDDGTFDAAACTFGLLHFPRPEQAMREARRVLRIGGRYTFTVWCSAEQGGDFHQLVMGAIQRHGNKDVPPPPAPPLYRFADPKECERTLAAAGFMTPETRILPLMWRAATPQAVLDLVYKGTVRLPMILDVQSPAARQRIHEAILAGAQAFEKDGAIELRFPALMATAVRD